MLRLELRGEMSQPMVYLSPIFAVILTFIAGIVMFTFLGVDPVKAIITFFINPLNSLDGLAELFVKATPLVLIAVGLSFGFQANIWNIGAEGQLTIGALAGGGVALLFFNVDTPFLMPAK